MKINLISIITFFLISTCYAQVKFEKGYYIDVSGNRISGYIENQDWNDNPESFNFKINENSEPEFKTIDNILEFGVANSRFLKAKVQVDLSRNLVRELTENRSPEFTTRVVLLSYLIDGQADLFLYRKNGVLRYFFREDNNIPEQLIYKRYLISGKIAINNYFQQQLFVMLNCSNRDVADYKKISYSKSDLENYFIDYNKCSDAAISNYGKYNSSGKLNIKALVGADFTNMDIENGLNATGISLANEISIRVGAEIEYVLPFNKNKWAVFAQPVYRSFKAEKHLTKSYESDFSINSRSVELAIGVRHYFFLSSTTKLFVNAVVSADLPVNTEVAFANTFMNEDPFLDEFKSGSSFGVGAGATLFNKLAVEFRYNSSRDLNGSRFVDGTYNLDFVSSYGTASLIFTYSFL
ncbi:hypothetical protein [Gillisia sp. Hel_I_29]|uniref:hypothetical protein n=1 Tax=Gillisia sp. Hel_I_29 TaxID=1249975 RepID=UPI00054F77D4|nr:hypothetical protein [Gillisia sp. Hel_I_29]